jgi:hypothetical protein
MPFRRISTKHFNKFFLLLFILLLLFTDHAFGWHDETHLAVAKAAGYYKWYNATGADMAKIKAGWVEGYNHFFNNSKKKEITPEMVLDQAARYNHPNDKEGHLYGAIIASIREYKKIIKESKYAEYHIAFCVHYIADLSQPLHNIAYDDFNKSRHSENDGIIDNNILENLVKIRKHMYNVNLRRDHFEYDLAKEIARVANQARRLGYMLKKTNRNMTEDEAYTQLGHSTSLLKAVLAHINKK